MKYKGIKIERPYDTTKDGYQKIKSILTFKEIFDLTPNISDIFGTINSVKHGHKSCTFRSVHNFMDDKLNKTECIKKFQVSKFFHREFICYRFSIDANKRHENDPRADFLDAKLDAHKHHYNMIKVALSSDSPARFFKLYLNGNHFKDIEYFTLFVHHQDSSQLFDSSLTTLMIRERLSLDARESIEVASTYYSTRIKRLSAPYDTNCQDLSPFVTADGKEFNCSNTKLMKRHHLISSLGQLDIGILNYTTDIGAFVADAKIRNDKLSGNDVQRLIHQIRDSNYRLHKMDKIISFEDDQQIHLLEETLKSCKIIDRQTCDFKYVATRSTIKQWTSDGHDGHDENGFSVSLNWPQDSNVEIVHAPKVALIDYIFQFTSCFSVWFNVDFLLILSFGLIVIRRDAEVGVRFVDKKKYVSALKRMKNEDFKRKIHFERQFYSKIGIQIEKSENFICKRISFAKQRLINNNNN